jgi:hypothetical protein
MEIYHYSKIYHDLSWSTMIGWIFTMLPLGVMYIIQFLSDDKTCRSHTQFERTTYIDIVEGTLFTFY